MPNADTMGNTIRHHFLSLPQKTNGRVVCIENLGTLAYFSCMKHCSFLMGNSSSGIIEAASFHKKVINLGDRQKSRVKSNNVIDVKIKSLEILDAIKEIEKTPDYSGENIYFRKGAAISIIEILKSI
jgi:GDP/UDP-N,N'-diacetylbacillosamine 2-epimerase (hydrolysing)